MDTIGYICEAIIGQFQKGFPVVLASIVSMEGSTPRESGSKMVVARGGSTFGTVGGGLLEAVTIRESNKVLETGTSRFIEFDMTGTDTSSPDMICGGSAVLLLDYLESTSSNLEIVTRMKEFIDNGSSFYFITGYEEADADVRVSGHCLLFSTGSIVGDAVLPENILPEVREELHNLSSTEILEFGGRKYLIDPIRRVKTMYCFGAGHVAVPTAHLASLVGFRVVVVDDREEYANTERFPDADEVRVIDDYNRALEGFEIDADSFIVILTRGHRYDREVLEQSLKTKAGYIGMISSRKKRDTVYQTLIREGVTTADRLEHVHSPIGLSIGAETPEEIAVSIVGEMIAERGKTK